MYCDLYLSSKMYRNDERKPKGETQREADRETSATGTAVWGEHVRKTGTGPCLKLDVIRHTDLIHLVQDGNCLRFQ
jgi:hypothetical protein